MSIASNLNFNPEFMLFQRWQLLSVAERLFESGTFEGRLLRGGSQTVWRVSVLYRPQRRSELSILTLSALMDAAAVT